MWNKIKTTYDYTDFININQSNSDDAWELTDKEKKYFEYINFIYKKYN